MIRKLMPQRTQRAQRFFFLLFSVLSVISVASFFLLASTPARAGGPAVFKLDPTSRFEVKTKSAGVFGGLGHDHVIRAKAPAGEVRYDADALAASSVKVEVDAATLEVADADVSESDRKKIDESMKGADVLDVARWKTISFASTRVQGIPPSLNVKGDLTLHGVTRSVDVAVKLATEDGGRKVRASGAFKVKTSDFGMKPYSAALGTVKVADEIELVFEAVGARAGD